MPCTDVIDYVLDAGEQRIAKKVNSVIEEKYFWAGLTRLLAVYDGSDNLVVRFEYADGPLPVKMVQGGNIYYLAYDQVGSLRAVLNASGTIVHEITYDSFGNILTETNSGLTIPLGFAGGLHDRDTSLVRFGYRDCDPDAGRWTAKDPIGFGGGNLDLYAYCMNAPVNLNDPLGLKVYIEIHRIHDNGSSVMGTLSASSDKATAGTLTYTMEPSVGGWKPYKPPIAAGTYEAFLRTDHNPDRIELRNVPQYLNIQIHNGNSILSQDGETPPHSIGCFLVGDGIGTDAIRGGTSIAAMNRILEVVNADASGEIEVTVVDPPEGPMNTWGERTLTLNDPLVPKNSLRDLLAQMGAGAPQDNDKISVP